jgi:hypothetical protein
MKKVYKLFLILSFNLFQVQSSDGIFASLGSLFKDHIVEVVGVTSFLAALVSIEVKNKMKNKEEKNAPVGMQCLSVCPLAGSLYILRKL